MKSVKSVARDVGLGMIGTRVNNRFSRGEKNPLPEGVFKSDSVPF